MAKTQHEESINLGEQVGDGNSLAVDRLQSESLSKASFSAGSGTPIFDSR